MSTYQDWETTKLLYDVKRLFQSSEKAFLLYYDLKQRINPDKSNDILLIFHNPKALMQCYIRSRGNVDNATYKDDIKQITIGKINYKFVCIDDDIYNDTSSSLKRQYFADIQFKEAYGKIP